MVSLSVLVHSLTLFRSDANSRHLPFYSVQNFGLFQGNYKTKSRDRVQTNSGAAGAGFASEDSRHHYFRPYSQTSRGELGADGALTDQSSRPAGEEQDGAESELTHI
ncbi:hypothetical protein R3P38DRAFT_2863946, partial [Favolaschia claudopus]